MLACTLDMVASRLFDANGCGDIRLDMLNFVRKKTPEIGGENIVLAVHIRRDGEEPAVVETAGNSGTAGTIGTAGHVHRCGCKTESPGTSADVPVRGKIPEA